MSGYHLSPSTGAYEPCRATKRACLYKRITKDEYYGLLQAQPLKRDTLKSRTVDIKGATGVTFDDTKVAPESYMGIFCLKCETYTPNSLAEKVMHNSDHRHAPKCNYCNEPLKVELMGVDLRFSEQKFLNIDNVRKATWYHLTSNPNWHEAVTSYEVTNANTPMVHVGSKEASLDRLKDLRRWSAEGHGQYYLYELTIAPSAKINENIFQDEDEDIPKNVAQANKNSSYNNNINRYLNRYEAPGTISLCANPHMLSVKNVVDITL